MADADGGAPHTNPGPPPQRDGQRTGSILKQYVPGAAAQQGKREYMEDRHMIVRDFKPSGGFAAGVGSGCDYAAVFDGHAGPEAAELASNTLHHVLAEEISKCQHNDAVEVARAFKRVFKLVDGQIIQHIKQTQGASYGTTAVVTLRVGQTLYVAHAGDSGAILGRLGMAWRLTEDHKAGVAGEAERIHQRGGETTADQSYVKSMPKPGRARHHLAMSRALGDPDFKDPGRELVVPDPEVARVELQPGDSAVVLASDGVWDVVGDQDAVKLVDAVVKEHRERRGGAVSGDVACQAATALVDMALDYKSMDNVTALVVLLEWDGEE